MPVQATLDVQALRNEVDTMVKALTHPAYVEAMRAVREAPIESRLAEGSKRLHPDALRAAGVPLPDKMRISSRYFEDGLPTSVEFGDTPEGPNLVNALNEGRPGFLDELRADNPALFSKLLNTDKMRFMATPGCCCGGAASACGGCG